MKHLLNLYPGARFSSGGKTFHVIRHEANMTEVYSHALHRPLAWWCWTKVTPL